MSKKSVCDDCAHSGICKKQEITQGLEKEISILYHNLIISDGRVIKNTPLSKNSYDLSNNGIGYEVTCDRKLPKDKIKDDAEMGYKRL